MELAEAYKFCPRCGNKATLKPRHLSCPDCGLDTYFNPKPVVSVLLRNSKGEYLFSQRGEEPSKGLYDFPGGFLEEGESFETAAYREIKEELGIKLDKIKFLGTYSETYLSQGLNYSLVGVAYTADLADDAIIKPADDVAAVKFFSLDNFPKDELAGPSELEIIEDLRKLRT